MTTAEIKLPVAPAAEWQTGLYQMAREQFERAATLIHLDDEFSERLIEPRRALIVNFPIKTDGGAVRSFTGYRIQHTLTMGPTKGGLRFSPDISLGECAALAMWMTWKCALLRLPYGGAKGGVRCDPKLLSTGELESLTRRYASELSPVIGPNQDIPAPDMGTDARVMGWIYDTYSQAVGYSVPAVVTGKSPVIGGTEGRQAATGLGVIYALEALLERSGRNIDGQRLVVQGFGNVGSVVAKRAHAKGASIVAVSDADGGIVNELGIDIPALLQWVGAGGALPDFSGGERADRAEILELACDAVIPAALERQITSENADRLKCQYVVEAANGPTTPKADRILNTRGIQVVPDILANAGGVTVSYFEWVQSHQRLPWSLDEVELRLRDQIRTAFFAVDDRAQKDGTDYREAALSLAIERVAEAARQRGVYP